MTYTGNMLSDLEGIVQRNLGNDPLGRWCSNIQKFMDEMPDRRCAGHILATIGGYQRPACQDMAVISLVPWEIEEKYGEGEHFSLCWTCHTHYVLGYFNPVVSR